MNVEHAGMVQFDQFDTSLVDNGNICLLGVSGRGKTVTTQTLITRMLDWGYGVNIVDVLGNYKTLTQRYKGQYVSFGEGKNDGHVNFFQLLPGESVKQKLAACRGLFGIIFEELPQNDWALLE